MSNYQEVRVILTNAQLNKLKSIAKIKKGTILILHKTNFEDEEFPRQISKIIQPGGLFGSWLGT